MENSTMKDTLKKLKLWRKIPGNTISSLAHYCGYDDAAAIKQWLIRESIPNYQIIKVMEFIDGKPSKSSKKG